MSVVPLSVASWPAVYHNVICTGGIENEIANGRGVYADADDPALPPSAQEQSEQAKPPATKLEAFQARTGIVVIRGYSTVRTVRGLGATVTVDAREFRDASNPKSRETGISISVKEAGRLERENTSFVDADEIDSLLRGIDYITKIGKDVTTLQNFEADYRTKGDLMVTVYNDSSGQIKAAISSGRIGRTRAFVELSALEEFRRLIVTAKGKL